MKPSRHVALRILAYFCIILVLSTCASGTTPFSTNIYEYNETGPQEPAAISISDPQIYARETLINDRLIERQLLNELLKESKEVDFRNEIARPAMIRDIETLEALRMAAEIAYNPTQGRVARRDDDLAELDYRIALAKKENELLKIRESQNKSPTESDSEAGPTSTPDESSGNSSGDDEDTDGEETNEEDSQDPPIPESSDSNESDSDSNDDEEAGNSASNGIAATEKRIDEISKRLDNIAKRLGDRKATMPIPEAERARDAYRAEIRHRLNALSLDDLHDHNGNSLYRMQFRATVMPGRHKDKFGIARLTFLPPILSDGDLDELYRTWLLHLANRLNSPFPEIRGLCPKPLGSFLRLAESGAVKFAKVDYARSREKSDDGISITITEELKLWSGDTQQKHSSDEGDCVLYVPLRPNESVYSIAGMQILEVIAAVNRDNRKTVEAARRAIYKISNSGRVMWYPLIDSNKAPDIFKSILRRTDNSAGERDLQGTKITYADFVMSPSEVAVGRAYRANGAAYAYSVTPLEKSQTISTHARTARSLEMALSLVATLPSAGADGKLDMARVRESAGIIEAFEDQAIVVGFAERRGTIEREQKGVTDPVYKSDDQSPQVGWIFGPKVKIDTEKSELKLIHGYSAHEVSADLSIPGWWPRVDAILETAWIGNLHNSGRPIRLEDEAGQGFHRERFKVELPLNSADLDGLTEFIAGKLVGKSLPITAIQHVEPYYVSACSTNLNVIIKGPNVWRSATAFLGGVEAERISILPDMEGIAAFFDLDKLFSRLNKSLLDIGLEQNVLLTVWTRNGSDQLTLRLLGNRVPGSPGSCIAPTTVSATTQPYRFDIVHVSPPQICAKWTEANFIVKAVNVRNKVIKVLFANSVGTGKELGTYGKNSVYQFQFKGGPFAAEQRILPLTATSGDDISALPVRVVACDTKPSKPKPKPKPVKKSSVIETFTVANDKDTSNYSFQITLDDIDKSFFADDHGAALRVGVLPKVEAAGGRWISSQTEPVFSNSTYTADFKIARNASSNPALSFREPQELRFALFRLINGKRKSILELDTNPIYYPSKSKAGVKATGPKDISKGGEQLELALPWKFQEAYPALSKSKLHATVTANPVIKLVVTMDFSKVDSDRKLKGIIALADDASEVEWIKLKGEQVIELVFEGRGMPQVNSITIKNPN